ncbi:MAG: hypothetical protein IPK17_35345 [Chloroflexi bacterium]|uniref:hypothetical protein n=1 Tax=Candidatus Flexifilum breve TaxID=3140694 RepID=UPI003134B731|nr:hypothetical protein [Chloroflexota bacterium]
MGDERVSESAVDAALLEERLRRLYREFADELLPPLRCDHRDQIRLDACRRG